MMDEFDITGPLPSPGTTVLEASAGTGKTWTIAALVARYVAEGVTPLEQMLVVTFGRAASQELRQRVRERLVDVERLLTDPPANPDQDDQLDTLLRLMLACDDAERALRLQRVRSALSGFDAASILTIHQFCQTVLRGLGVAGDSDPDAHLVEDLDDLLTEVIDDLYLNLVRGPDGAQVAGQLPRAEAGRIGFEAALRNPLARLEPAEAHEHSTAALRVRFAEAVRAEFSLRKRRQGILSYDDLLAQLADALEPLDSLARQRMRERWSLVLVDEFQDTDPTQWLVFERAFHDVPSAEARPTLVLIGDPKQAIYAFRGGDVQTYLSAREVAHTSATLTRNHRTDAAVLDRVNVLLAGAELGDPRIVVHPIRAAKVKAELAGQHGEPFRLRALTRDPDPAEATKPIRIDVARRRIARDLAAEVQSMLADPDLLVVDPKGPSGGRRVRAGDIAVLAYSRPQLAHARQALTRVGIASVMAGAGSVFATAAAQSWRTLMEALEQPHRTARVRAAALTPFFGYTINSLDAGGEDLTEQLAAQVRDWLDVFRTRGVAALFESALEAGMDSRVLGTVNGERDLTDLQHLAEVLHEEALSGRSGVVALTAWLVEQMRDDRDDVSGDRTRRLDSDAHAVQLVTIHGSKGLEYPIVMLPFAFDRFLGDRRDDLIAYHDEAGRRILHVGGAADRPLHLDEVANAEDQGERLRLLYVAMTRAKSQLLVWWAPSTNTPPSELHRMIFGRKPGEAVVPAITPLKGDPEHISWLRAWAGKGSFELERLEGEPALARSVAPSGPTLAARHFTRDVDHGWRRTSYSSLSAPAHDSPGVGSEPEIVMLEDEIDDLVLPEVAVDTTLEHLPSPFAELPAGAQFGSLVHAVLEHADPAAPDLLAELRRAVDEQWIFWPSNVDRDLLASALLAVCETPLGEIAAGARLRDIGLADRLMELEFELPLSGGDFARRRSGPRLADLAPILTRHLPEGDPVRGWVTALANPLLGEQELRGYLTGSVDVVLRVDGRYLVVDYKTNYLGTFGEPLTTADYTPAALDAAMAHSDYPLQALLYAVVLHRFLRWRLPGYDPEAHLGGVLYLYLRGMCGPDTPVIDGQPCGVFTWRPPVGLVIAVSDLLDGGDHG